MQSDAIEWRSLPSYDFTSDWADLSAVPDAATSWAHNGLVITADGELIGFHAGQLVAFDQGGPRSTCRPARSHRGPWHHLGAGRR